MTMAVLLLAALVGANPAAAATLTYSGDIMTDLQYDLYTVPLQAGQVITATLVCDEIAPGDRPLDPVLSVFFPGGDPSSIASADLYNDDGFGQDDANNGVECNSFDSSRIRFLVPQTGNYVFRADGFGSATGPYTLDILIGPPVGAPALDALGMALGVLALAAVALLQVRRLRA
ncbi:hypothetical protein KF840_04700 [bacterium]|nr:hypothetical protein [bacterium]